MRLEEDVRELLNERIGYLCTSDPKGRPHITPIFFVYNFNSDEFYFISNIRSKKISNIFKVGAVALAVDIRDEENPFNNRGILIRGSIERVIDVSMRLAAEAKRALDLFFQKYMEFSPYVHPKSEPFKTFYDLLVIAKARKITYWRGPKFRFLK